MTAAKPIGIVGFGLMGSALAQRLIGAGYGVVGFDIDAEKLRSLEKLGGTAAASPADAARLCDVLFLAVFNTEQVEEVVERDLLPALGAGSGKICCAPAPATMTARGASPSASRQRAAPPRYPISGTSEQVRRGRGVALWAAMKPRSPMSRTSSAPCFPPISTWVLPAMPAAPSSPSI
jgi:3-hydroxyisobutyrate dehydrogenase-like beta-hydroxyacid dehydrogenase